MEIPDLLVSQIHERKKIVCAYLQELPGTAGFLYNNYALGGTKGQEFERQYYSDENAMKCDTIRSKIEERKEQDAGRFRKGVFRGESLIAVVQVGLTGASRAMRQPLVEED